MVEVAGKRIPTWAVMVAVFLVAGFAIGGISRCTESKIASERAENASNQAAQPQEAPEVLPAFKVAKVEDVSVSATPRFEYRIVVSGQPTPQQLTLVAETVFRKAQNERTFSALRIGFYDFAEFVGREYTLGVVDYAPDGDWANASTIESGDYDSMKAKADLRTKDWSKQLTPDEVSVWAAWRAEYDAAAKAIGSDPSKMVDEDVVTKRVAKSTGRSAEEVQAILIKQQVWASQ